MGILSTENNISREIDFEDIIHEFASIRAKGVYFAFCLRSTTAHRHWGADTRVVSYVSLQGSILWTLSTLCFLSSWKFLMSVHKRFTDAEGSELWKVRQRAQCPSQQLCHIRGVLVKMSWKCPLRRKAGIWVWHQEGTDARLNQSPSSFLRKNIPHHLYLVLVRLQL